MNPHEVPVPTRLANGTFEPGATATPPSGATEIPFGPRATLPPNVPPLGPLPPKPKPPTAPPPCAKLPPNPPPPP